MSAPTKNTKGCIGDTYVDTDTGEKYVCVFAFSDSFGTDEYEWKLDSVTECPEETENESEKIPGVEISENNSESSEDLKNNSINKPKYNNYSKQYKSNRN